MVWLSQSARVRPARAEGSRRLSTREPAVPRSAIHRPSYSRILTAESHLAAAAEDARPWPLSSAGTAEHCLCRANTAWHSLTITVARSSSSSALAPVQRSVLSHGIASRTVFICCMPCCLVDVYAVVHVSCWALCRRTEWRMCSRCKRSTRYSRGCRLQATSLRAHRRGLRARAAYD